MTFFLKFLVSLMVAASIAGGVSGQASGDDTRLDQVRKLYSEKKWEQAAREAQGPRGRPAELDYFAGMALARLERWSESRDAFSAGARKAPRDARFLTERAGAEYKLGDYRAAKNDLRRALRLDLDDSYVFEFLGTIYLLEDNLEAALKYWNLAGKPKLTAVEVSPPVKRGKQWLDRAVGFAPPGTLERVALLKTDALLENLGVFPRTRLELAPDRDDGYKATVKLTERSGWGATPLDGALSLLHGLPYQTVFPSWYGIAGQPVNFDSLARWDAEKRRFAANLEFPFSDRPAKRTRVFFDVRNENWNLQNSFFGGPVPITDLNMRRFAGGAEIHSVESGWWDWTAGAGAVSREFRNVPSGLAPQASPFFTDGLSLDAWMVVRRWLVRLPEHRFTLEGTGGIRGGRTYAAGLGAFGSLNGGLAARWLPHARGDDLELTSRLGGGATIGEVPLDFLYELGVERDNDLWMRGHDGTLDGRKGNAPLGRRYVLWNSELNKNVYDNGFFRLQFGPFFDTGRVGDSSALFGSKKWLVDAGVQAKARVLGSVSVVLSYGWNLRGGTGLFYASSER